MNDDGPRAGAGAAALLRSELRDELAALRAQGVWKSERVLASAQGARVRDADGRELINLCDNNYLGLASDARVVAAAKAALDLRGHGLASVRFICGTQDLHRALEQRLARFVGCDDAILYAAAFDANGGLFEPLLDERDAVISDALNHASIIDGIRLSKAQRWRYAHDDMADLQRCLREAQAAGTRRRLVFTDGVFSMDGTIARLGEMRALCDAHGALLGVDDCHGLGVLGERGRGSAEHLGLHGRIDIITGTLGKALGGACGGFTAGSQELVALLRQRSRPYLFSNSLPPPIVAAALTVLDLLEADASALARLHANTAWFRAAASDAGYQLRPGTHPIVPIIVHDAHLAQKLAARLLELGVLAVAFAYPVVPQGQARLRVQVGAQHSRADLEAAVAALRQAGAELGLLGA